MGDATIETLQGINGDQLLRNSRTHGGGPDMMVRMAPPPGGADGEAQALRNSARRHGAASRSRCC